MRGSAAANACMRASVSSVLQSSTRTIPYGRSAPAAARIDSTVGSTLSCSLKHGTTKQIEDRSVIRLSNTGSAQPYQLLAVAAGGLARRSSGSSRRVVLALALVALARHRRG